MANYRQLASFTIFYEEIVINMLISRSLIIPAGILVLLIVVLGVGLILDPQEVPPRFIDKSVAPFSVSDLQNKNKILTNQDLIGKVWLVNVWASWCAPCRDEHSLLMQIVRSHDISLFGLNYQDRSEDALRWLEKMGNPYRLIGADTTGQVGLDWGVRGTPESFVLDRKGVIRFKQIGPLDPEILKNEIIPLIEQLQAEAA
ncbi:Thiol:disulfide interchange protein DsbE [Gammaproteobacteria bacterium]